MKPSYMWYTNHYGNCQILISQNSYLKSFLMKKIALLILLTYTSIAYSQVKGAYTGNSEAQSKLTKNSASSSSKSLGAADPALPVKHFSYPERISYDGSSLKIEGKDVFIYSAAFHYFRTPKELWRDRFTKIKAAGFNTIETYIPWNLSELNKPANINDYSQVDFSDLKEWLNMAQNEFGFYTVLRPGPFICAEFAGGGYPRWLAKYRPDDVKEFWLRSADNRYLDWCDHWYKAVCAFIAKEQITAKPKGQKGVILMQIENEYDHHKTTNKVYALQRLYKATQNAGVKVPVFTCMTAESRASKDSLLSQVFDCDNYYVIKKDAITCAKRMQDLKQKQPDAPGFVTELQGGWFATVKGPLSEDNYSDDKHFYALGMMSILGGSTGIFPYVFVGGTHFAGWGARGQTTSYDYNAAIRENGALSPKYYAAQNLGTFIKKYGSSLIQSRGGVCAFQNVPAEVAGGIRMAQDGTEFVFMHNSSAEKASGTVLIQPGKNVEASKPMYNLDQNANKVLIEQNSDNTSSLKGIPDLSLNYNLEPMETKVFIIPAGSDSRSGHWWTLENPQSQTPQPLNVRIKEVKKYNEDLKAKWQPLSEGVSLPEIGVNDLRYVLYRSNFKLNADELNKYNHLLFNTFSRDIINVKVNGKLAPREFPSETWAAEVTRPRDKSFTFIKDTDYLNRFNIKGLLQKGKNEIELVYENIGHEHGYFPMEELCGINVAGFGDTDSTLLRKLSWEVSTDLAGIQKGFVEPSFSPKNWQTVQLDMLNLVPRRGNNIQPKGKQDALLTWYRAEFKLPDNATKTNTWRLLINASGNGDMYINGHNIGKHWEAGAQREFYLPECWLNTGNKPNIIVLSLRQTVNGAVIKAMEVASYTNNYVVAEKR